MKRPVTEMILVPLAIICLACASWLVLSPNRMVLKRVHFQLKNERMSEDKPGLFRHPPPKLAAWHEPDHPACALLEDGKPLLRVNSTKAAERSRTGVFTVGPKSIWLASTDGSSPMANRRNYTMIIPVTLPRSAAIWLLLPVVACGLHRGSRAWLIWIGTALLPFKPQKS